jgi:hypothetical protein
MKKLLLSLGIIFSFVPNILLTNPAKAEVQIYYFTYRYESFDLWFLHKTLIRQTSLGKLYSVELEYRNRQRLDPATGYTTSIRSPNYQSNVKVFCSTSRPAIVNQYDNLSQLYVNFINPGVFTTSEIGRPNYAIYWTTCHNFISSIGDEQQAIRFGYPLNLRDRQERINNISQLIEPSSSTQTQTQSTNRYSRCSTNPNNYCLRQGDRGQLINELISNLTCLNYYSGVNDGIFGSGTETGVRNFQRDHGLTLDGIAGPQTRNLLNQQCRIRSNPNVPNIIGMEYDQARNTLINAGWRPRLNTWEGDGSEFYGPEEALIRNGYTELIMCTGTGTVPCSFLFTDNNGNYLKVVTTGQLFPPGVDKWYLSREIPTIPF